MIFFVSEIAVDSIGLSLSEQLPVTDNALIISKEFII